MQKFLPLILFVFPTIATAATFQNDSVYAASEIGTALAGNGAIADNAATLRANPASISHLSGLNISVSDVMQFNKRKYYNSRAFCKCRFRTANFASFASIDCRKPKI